MIASRRNARPRGAARKPGGTRMLTLDISEYRGITSWHAALHDADGTLLAVHDVRLDERCSEFELLADLYRGLWRLDVDPARRDASARALLARVGAYAADQVLGNIAHALAARAPVSVALRLPPDAVQLSVLPLELATVAGRTLVESGVVLAHQVVPSRAPSVPQRSADGESLRVLAVFALPEGVSALALVRERRALTALLRGVAGERQVEAQVLQYGATRDSLEAALADPRGWDVVHLSGHGAPGGLQFEDEDGRRQRIDRLQLVEMFRPCAGRTNLAVLAACESGAVRAMRRRTPPHGRAPTHAPGTTEVQRAPSVLPSLGHDLHAAIGCSVLAMRFPVDDRFAVAFVSTWYEALLRDGATTGEALGRALRAGSTRHGLSLVSAVTPVLLGDPALRLTRPVSPRAATTQGATSPSQHPVAAAPPAPPELFVGRGSLVSQLSRLLSASDGAARPVLVVGGPGAGKTACVAEAVEWCRDQVDVVRWHRLTHRATPASLRRSLRPLLGRPGDIHTAIAVLDDVEALLTDDGCWRDADVGAAVAELCAAAGPRLRVVLVADRLVKPRPAGAIVLAVGSLSRSESEWLAREYQELAWGELGDDALLPQVGLPWLVCRGHPRLIEYCSQGSVRQALARTRTMDAAWEVTSPTPAPGEPRGRPVLGARHPGARVTAWARDRANALPRAPQLLFSVLAGLEASDRRPEVVDTLWPVLQEVVDGAAVPLENAMPPLIDRGLVEVSDRYFWIHPGAARAGRDLSRRVEVLTAHTAAHHWSRYYDYGSADADGPHQDSLGQVAARCVPYLMRLGRWEEASARCEEAINHDRSPEMASRLLPFLREIVRATRETPLGRQTRYVAYMVLAQVNPATALRGLETLYAEAVAEGDTLVSLACASGIVDVSRGSEPLEARDWLRRAQEASASGSVGPWPLLLLRLYEAQVLLELHAPGEGLDCAQQVLAEFEQLQATGVRPSGVNPHTLLVAALEAAATAAHGLGDRSLEQKFRRRSLEVAAGPGATVRAVAQVQFNQVLQMLRAGQLDEAQAMLVAARAHFQNPGDQKELGLVLIELAGLEHLRGHDGDAVELGRQALRASYAAGEWLDAARSHQRLATFLAGRAESAQEAPVHLLAAAVIQYRAAAGLVAVWQSPQLLNSITLLRLCLAKHPSAVPGSDEGLAAALREKTGVDVEPFLAASERIPARRDPSGQLILTWGPEPPGDGDSVSDVLTIVHEPPLPAALLDPERYPEYWREIVDQVTSAAGSVGVPGVADFCDDLASAGWGDLAAAIRAIAGGLRVMPTFVNGAMPEHTIITRILELVVRS